MVSVLTWLTDKTDNINLVIEVAVGIVVTASVAGPVETKNTAVAAITGIRPLCRSHRRQSC